MKVSVNKNTYSGTTIATIEFDDLIKTTVMDVLAKARNELVSEIKQKILNEKIPDILTQIDAKALVNTAMLELLQTQLKKENK